jgi:hypothetical protein
MTHVQGSGHEVFVSVPALIYDQQAVDMVHAYERGWHLGRDFRLSLTAVSSIKTMIRQRIADSRS